MYRRFADEMEYANVAVWFDTPVLMNCDGDIVENEEDTFGVESRTM